MFQASATNQFLHKVLRRIMTHLGRTMAYIVFSDVSFDFITVSAI